MELSLLLLQKIITLLLIVFMGFLSVKSGSVKTEHSSVLSHICFDWIVPCSILNSFLNTNADDVMSNFLFVCAVTLGMILMFIGITFLISKPLHLNPTETGSLMFTNSAGMALPMATALLGSESVIFCSPHMGIQNIFIFTLLPFLMHGTQKGGLKRALLNRNVVSIGIGLFLFATKFPLPKILLDTITTVGGTISPVCMLMIGMLMGGVDFKKLLRNWRLYAICLARLIIYPLIAILVLKITRIPYLKPSASVGLMVMIMCISSPIATLITQMADLYRSREEAQDSGSMNIISTLMCAITMPIMVFIYQIIIGV